MVMPLPSTPWAWTLSARCIATPWLVASPTLVVGLSAWAMVPVSGSAASLRTADSGTKPSSVPLSASTAWTASPRASACLRNDARLTSA